MTHEPSSLWGTLLGPVGGASSGLPFLITFCAFKECQIMKATLALSVLQDLIYASYLFFEIVFLRRISSDSLG